MIRRMGMALNLYDFEVMNLISKGNKKKNMTDEEINEKYESGEHRIVTEQGAFKLDLISAIFSHKKYNLKPEFQRRITWDNKKRSKLIESFIMNIPVPPVFLYEEDYSSYVVMDGLQRISAIMDFYRDVYELRGLEEWSELNGKKYSELPKKVREGIDRRQLSVITLLKESADDRITADKMKKMVFERLNTGGVQLEDQEIRNALFTGKFNDCCMKLSENKVFKQLWGIEGITGSDVGENLHDLDEEESLLAAKNKLYRRMYDVELVLRYFAMRNVRGYTGKLSKYLDEYLNFANSYSDEQIKMLENEFNSAIDNAYKVFGKKAFCIYREGKGWSQPQNMIYDAIMLVMSDEAIKDKSISLDMEKNIEGLKKLYIEKADYFNGKKQSKTDIVQRASLLKNYILDNLME